MVYAENKYMTMKRSNLWNAPTKEEQEIMALTAQVAQLKQGANRSSDVSGSTVLELTTTAKIMPGSSSPLVLMTHRRRL